MDLAGAGSSRVSPGPESIIVPPRAKGGPRVARREIDSDDLRGGAFKKQAVGRTRSLVSRVSNLDVTALDRELATERLDAFVTEIGVLNARQSAAGQETDRGAPCACGAREAV